MAKAQAATQSVYIPVGTEIHLATDIYLPDAEILSNPSISSYSTVLIMTRYGRATRFSAKAIETLNRLGFAVIMVDMRGSGASEGTRHATFSLEERADIKLILDWIAAQEWSDGKIITTGVSYDANLADFAIQTNHPNLAAVVSRFGDYDLYRHLLAPGGIRNQFLIREWAQYVYSADRGIDCVLDLAACAGQKRSKAVDGKFGLEKLRNALLQHQNNWDPYSATMAYEFIDDFLPSGRRPVDGFISSYHDDFRKSKVPQQIWASWMDAATAETALVRYLINEKAPVEVYIGAWNHGGTIGVDPFLTGEQMAEQDTVQPCVEFIRFIGGVRSGKAVESVIHYYTMGGGGWKSSSSWPPKGTITTRLFPSVDSRLTAKLLADDNGSDSYAIDYGATTGQQNRWYTQMGGGAVTYSGWTDMQKRMLVYTSPPLETPLEITGSPIAHLTLSVSHPDAAVYVYLSVVMPSGQVYYITEGQLRLKNRKIAGDHPAFPTAFAELRSFNRKDATPWQPGEIEAVDIRLLPTSVILPVGYRLQLSIAGHDADTFARYPAKGDVHIKLLRGLESPSYIEIPHAGGDDGMAFPLQSHSD